MVLKRRLDYGLNRCEFPVIPRGPRSVRRRVSHKGNSEDNEIGAFELLAAVAGQLLQENESSASSNAAEEKGPFSIQCGGGFEKEKKEKTKTLTPEVFDRGSCVGSLFLSGRPAEWSNTKSVSRQLIKNECDPVLDNATIVSVSNVSKKNGNKGKLDIPDIHTAGTKICLKNEGASPNSAESPNGYVDNCIEGQLEAKNSFNHDVSFISTNTLTDKLESNVNYYPLIKSNSSVQLTSFRDTVPNDSFPRHRNNVNINVNSRDDDEKFIGWDRFKPKVRAFRPLACSGFRRVRKFPTSKYWKVGPKLKDCEFSNAERDVKRIFRNRKSYHFSERIRRDIPHKKRKRFDGRSRHTYVREGSSESISNTPEKSRNEEKRGSALKRCKARGTSSPFVVQGTSFQSRDSHVKLSIKSFKVPELYIEVPETATVGSLKRTVMEAVTAILHAGLRVGVLLQGEKIKDDERTLLQTGISHNGNLDNIGFTLEPSSFTASPLVSPKAPPSLLPCETAQELTRFVGCPLVETGLADSDIDPLQVANFGDHVKINHELALFPTDVVTDVEKPDSRALISLPEASVDALSVVPLTPKAKKTELAQRRTRRPFSVGEVEALVEAVETLGTGRWRDVKLRAFENADHRTYVDLKDKWKTLVHTASISPQQRRGEPVPQELLDRVLRTHSYWSQHQIKQQHSKNSAEPLQLLNAQEGTV